MHWKPEIFYVEWYGSIFVCCVGFPSNILSFIVWSQKGMRHSSGYYLAASAVNDFLFLLLYLILNLQRQQGLNLLDRPVVCQLFPVVYYSVQYLGPMLVLGFTTERYISICHPLKRRKYCTVRRSKIVIAVLAALALCLSSMQGYFFVTTTINGVYSCGVRFWVMEGGNTSLQILWNLSIESLTFLLVPLTILVLNILVISAIRHPRLEQVNQRASRPQRNSATTVMLLAVSFYLILTTVPVTIVYLLFYEFQYHFQHGVLVDIIEDPLLQRWLTYELVRAFVSVFGATQYASDFIVYVITGKVFRKQLKRFFVKSLCAKSRCCDLQ